jgi:hypothetical protein
MLKALYAVGHRIGADHRLIVFSAGGRLSAAVVPHNLHYVGVTSINGLLRAGTQWGQWWDSVAKPFAERLDDPRERK